MNPFIPNTLGLDIISDPAMPEGKVVAHPYVPNVLLAHPRTVLGAGIELTFGLSYAQRSTMYGLIRTSERLGRKLPKFVDMRERVRYLDNVKP